jgi:hypothetical protein
MSRLFFQIINNKKSKIMSIIKAIICKGLGYLLHTVLETILHKQTTPERSENSSTETPQSPQTTPKNSNLPRGLRNNNPLNIRHNSDTFQGEVTGTDKSFKTFSCMPYGYRAGFVILHTYLMRGENTIAKIVSRWAPPNENDTEKYIAFVERFSGISRGRELTSIDGADYVLIVSAMSFMENGVNADISEIKAGFNLQNKIKMR